MVPGLEGEIPRDTNRSRACSSRGRAPQRGLEALEALALPLPFEQLIAGPAVLRAGDLLGAERARVPGRGLRGAAFGLGLEAQEVVGLAGLGVAARLAQGAHGGLV